MIAAQPARALQKAYADIASVQSVDIVTCFMHIIIGSCVTSVLPGEVCSLDAVATECPNASLIATTCCMMEGHQTNYDTACRTRG